MLNAIRSSLASKLLVAFLALTLLLVVGTAGYLFVSRDRQTTGAAESNADNRAAVLDQVLVRFTAGQSLSAARELAQQPSLAAALTAPDPLTALQTLFSASVPVDLSGEVLVVAGADGRIVYQRAAPDASSTVVPASAPPSVQASLSNGGYCPSVLAPSKGVACGIEVLSGEPSLDVSVPVVDSGRTVGAVAYLAPLGTQVDRYQALLDYPVAVISAETPDAMVRFGTSGPATVSTPSDLASQLTHGGPQVHAVYAGAGGAQVAGSFVPVASPSNGRVSAWIGVEAPLSDFVGDTRTDELTIVLIASLAALLTVVLVSLLVFSLVRRPVARLERGVARIAGGDYDTAVTVTSHDEIGRLGMSVNRMRDAIREYVTEIESARRRLGSAVDQMSAVSRALTGSATDVRGLESAVVDAAARLAGEGAGAVLLARDGHALRPSTLHPETLDVSELDKTDTQVRLLAGETVVAGRRDGTWTMAIPMFFQHEVVGALAVTGPGAIRESREVLSVLANNAAIARENARLFEQERETVRRLRELDAMKNDFLSTIQHELRTPLTAIVGLADLLEMCWPVWEEQPKLDAIRDIQVAAKNLQDIVETIIDFSLMDGDMLGLDPITFELAPVVEQAVAAVGEKHRDGLPVPVEVDVPAGVEVFADAERFEQVLRAIVDNAVKFSDGDGVVKVTARGSDAGVVRIEVRDEGIGIAESELPRVFDRFYQVDNTATRRHGGTGMGLALVKRLVDAHGARIEIRSRVGEGTSVFVEWPAAPGAAGGEARDVARERGDLESATETSEPPASTPNGSSQNGHHAAAPTPEAEPEAPAGSAMPVQ